MEGLIQPVEGEDAFGSDGNLCRDGTAEAGLTEAMACAKDDLIPEDEVHRAIGTEPGKTIEEVADYGHKREENRPRVRQV